MQKPELISLWKEQRKEANIQVFHVYDTKCNIYKKAWYEATLCLCTMKSKTI